MPEEQISLIIILKAAHAEDTINTRWLHIGSSGPMLEDKIDTRWLQGPPNDAHPKALSPSNIPYHNALKHRALALEHDLKGYVLPRHLPIQLHQTLMAEQLQQDKERHYLQDFSSKITGCAITSNGAYGFSTVKAPREDPHFAALRVAALRPNYGWH